jgi:hypothetical protein
MKMKFNQQSQAREISKRQKVSLVVNNVENRNLWGIRRLGWGIRRLRYQLQYRIFIDWKGRILSVDSKHSRGYIKSNELT